MFGKKKGTIKKLVGIKIKGWYEKMYKEVQRYVIYQEVPEVVQNHVVQKKMVYKELRGGM